MHHWERLAGLYTTSASKWASGTARRGRAKREQETGGHGKRCGHCGVLMEEAETRKGTDFRVAAEEERGYSISQAAARSW